MASARVQLVALLIATLIFSAAQCVASCAVEDFRPATPPCHPHSVPGHEIAAACGHDFLLPDAHPLSAAIDLPVAAIEISHSLTAAVLSTVPAFSPPAPERSRSRILRL